MAIPKDDMDVLPMIHRDEILVKGIPHVKSIIDKEMKEKNKM